MIQEKSTASFYIIKERVEIIFDLLLYVLMFKKPKNLETDVNLSKTLSKHIDDPTQGDNLTLRVKFQMNFNNLVLPSHLFVVELYHRGLYPLKRGLWKEDQGKFRKYQKSKRPSQTKENR